MRLRKVWVYGLGFALAASVAACGGGSNSASSTSATGSAGGRRRQEGRSGDGRRRQGHRSSLDGTAPKNATIKMNADPVCVKAEQRRPQSRRPTRSAATASRSRNVFVYVKDGLGNYVVRHADRAGEDRSEELPLPSARVRHARRPAARDRQQRSDAAQHPRDAEGQHGVQQRPADPGHEDDAHLHSEGSDGAVQVRRARLDERVRRRPRSTRTSR